MRRLISACWLGVACGFVGCAQPTPRLTIEEWAHPPTSAEVSALERAGHWERALLGHKMLLADPPNEAARRAACLGAARCLLALREHPAALVTVSPLPTEPVDDYDRARLALAAEAMTRLSAWQHAESLSEVALSRLDLNQRQGAWAGPCCANLAKAYLEMDKPRQAARMYRAAATQFRLFGRLQPSAECVAMALEIETILAEADKQALPRNADPGDHSATAQPPGVIIPGIVPRNAGPEENSAGDSP